MPQANYPIYRVSNQQMPPGCEAKAIGYLAKVATNGGADTLDLTLQLLAGAIDQIQAVYIDNSEGSQAFSLTCRGTNMNVTIPAFCQAWMPLLTLRDVPIFDFAETSAGNDVPVFFVNVPMPAAVWTT